METMMMTTTLEPGAMASTETDGNLFAAKTICLVLERGKFGNRKKANMAAVTVRADKNRLSMAKQLIASPELDAILQLDTEVNAFLGGIAFPSLMKGGIYTIPIAAVQHTETALKAFQARRSALVDVAVAAFDNRVAETVLPLGDVFNVHDYPTAEAFGATFKFSWRYVTFDTPTRLKAISAALFESEREKAAVNLSAVADSCRDAMRAGLAKMVAKMVERLTPDDDGKQKSFNKSAIENLNEFLDNFELRNVTDDSELAAVVAQARQTITGVDAKTLRSDDSTRAAVLGTFSGLADSLEVLTKNRSDRQITFEE